MKISIALAILLSALSGTAATKNVIVLIADDFGIDSHSLYNTNPAASLPPTPSINALAARGVRFANAYAYPVCSPTRSAMLTGRYGFRTGVTDVLDTAGAQGIYTNEFTLPEALFATHRCGSFGKWHLGGTAPIPNSVGGWPQFSGAFQGALGPNAGSYYTWTKTSNGMTRMNYSGYATSDNVNDALAWLGEQGKNRWFLWLGFNAPHTPYHLPPTNLCPHYAGLPGTTAHIQQNPRDYFEASVEGMDTELGRLLASINTNETTVIFLGDNGTAQGVIEPPYNIQGRAKGSLYEGGVHVPFIIAGPDIASPGRVSTEVVHVVDVFATVLELCRLNPASLLPRALPIDSRSLASILRNEPFLPAEPAVLMEDAGTGGGASFTGRAARLGRYKLIRRDSGVEEFYDLDADPVEATNLTGRSLTAVQQSSLDQLRARLIAWTNRPTIVSQAISAGTFSADTGWFANANFGLCRNADLAITNWNRVTNAILQDRGEVIRLTDPQPPVGQAFYRVGQQ